MKVTIDIVAKMNPCESRFTNFKKEYPDYNDDLTAFLGLDRITYADKVWVATRMLSHNQLVRWSIACAESTKHIFNDKFPDNPAVNNLLTYMSAIEDFDKMTTEQRATLRTLQRAAYAAANYANYAAASNAAYAASNAAYAAANYANYAAASNAAYAASNAAEEQQNLNLLFLCSLIDE